MAARRPLRTVPAMETNFPTHRVEVSFVGAPPAGQLERASGVDGIQIDGSTVRCLVTGSFQSFLEALTGHEVLTLRSTTTGGDS